MTIYLWATDVVLLALAYFAGRVHAQMQLRDAYSKTLRDLLDEVKALRLKVDRLANQYYVRDRGEF
jgi:hypothetical protein